MAQIAWETTDCRGKTVILHAENWLKHEKKRPEIAGLRDQARKTVESPNICVREKDDSINFYKRGVVPDRPDAYLHVIAVDDDDGTRSHVRSAWICYEIDPFEEFLCAPQMS